MPVFRFLLLLLCVLLLAGRASAQSQCLPVPLDYPVASASLTLGSGSVNNGTSISAIAGAGSEIQVNGVRTDALLTYPALNPSSFPAFSGPDVSPPNELQAGTYNTVSTPSNSGNKFFDLLGGSTVTNIRTLNQRTRNISFGAGTYFIETWNITAHKPAITTRGGTVRIYIGQLIDMSNATGPSTRFNQYGSVGDFQLFLYPNARFAGRHNTTFNGLIYSPGEASLRMGNNGRISGVIATNGPTSFGDNMAFTLTPEMRDELAGALRCARAEKFLFTVASDASSCSGQPISITALDANGNTVTAYTGTIQLSTSTGRGTWSAGLPAPAGTLTLGAADSGTASYTFSRSDRGVVNLALSNSVAEALTVSAVDPDVPSSSSTSGSIKFGDAAFVIEEDYVQPCNTCKEGRIAGLNVAVAGRSHNIRVRLVRKGSSGSCGVDTSYDGSKTLRIWRTDMSNGGLGWTAPSIFAPAGSSSVSPSPLAVPAGKPLLNNVALTFSKGEVLFNLTTTDIGRYTITLEDTSTSLTSTFSGSLGPLTVRPFALVVRNIVNRSNAFNPNGARSTDAIFTSAGVPFSATLGAYRWSSTADSNDDGLPDTSGSPATLSQTTAGGLAPRFATPVTLTPLVDSQTPAAIDGGVLGGLTGARFSAFSNGEATLSTLGYSEVGSFRLRSADAVVNFLGAAGVNLGLTVFNGSGAQNDRIGRFTPHSFDVLATPACGVSPSHFSYSGQPFAVDVVARNGSSLRDITENYDGALQFSKSVTLQPVPGSSVGAGTLANGSVASSAFVDGVASLSGSAGAPPRPVYTYNAKLTAPSTLALRATDGDSVSSAGAVEQGTQLRSGRLRLSSASGSDRMPLDLPLQLQYWSGQAWVPNPEDSCTSLGTASVFQTGKTNANATYTVNAVTLSAGSGAVHFNAPTSSTGVTAGSVDVALNLGTGTSSQSCLSSQGGSPAGVPWLRSQNGSCATTYDRDPSARATFGIYTAETRRQIHIRELR